MSGVTAREESDIEESLEPSDTGDDADHPASTPRPFTEEEKAWGAALHYSRRWFSKSAIKEPPVPMRDQARALGLTPQGNGLLFSDTRAGRLHTLIELMPPGERAGYLKLAQDRLEKWRLTQTDTPELGVSEQSPIDETLSTSGTPPEPNSQLLWQLPRLDDILPHNKELIQKAEQIQAHQSDDAQILAQTLQQTLESFNVRAEVRPEDISFGPTIVRIAIRPTGIPATCPDERDKNKKVIVCDVQGNIVYKSRTRISSILARQNDIAICLEAEYLRMEAPVPGRPYVGVEIPNKNSRIVTLREILESKEYQVAARKSKLTIALGKDVTNQVRVADLSRMPHLLIAGATGAGKSVALNTIIACLLTQATPEDVRLLMVDPKMVELSLYNGIPHLLSPVVTEVEKVVPLLKNGISEMERRYRLFSQLGVRNLEGYRKLRQERLAAGDSSLQNLPAIVIIIDELADLMLLAAEEVEEQIQRLTQLARATGIHLVIATQRPSVDVITGVIKANCPTRISFMVSSSVDSRTILDKGGAERLIGRGDMLYKPEDSPNPQRIQGTFIEDEEVVALVEYWRDTLKHQANSDTTTPLNIDSLVQLPLPTWNLEPVEKEKRQSRPAKGASREPAMSEVQLFEHLTAYLLYDTVFVDGTPLPVPLRELSFEDRLLVAEVVAWKIRGSAEKLNSKLRTKTGAELRDELVRRGLLDRDTQQPVHASERLAPLLVECGFIDAESLEPLIDEETSQQLPSEDKEADLLPTSL